MVRDVQASIRHVSLFFLLNATLFGGCKFDSTTLAGPSVALGQGLTEFLSVPDGAPVEVMCALEGTVWIWLAVRISGLDPGDPELEPREPGQPITHVTISVEENVTEYEIGAPYTSVDGQPGLHEIIGLMAGVVRPSPSDWCEVEGAAMSVSIEVTDATGASAADDRVWISTRSALWNCACW